MNSKPESEKPEVRIVLLGMTGLGKSASGNTILGSNRFKTGLSSSSVTNKCEKGIREFDEQTLAIVDTPGLFHTGKKREEVVKELLQSALMVAPGPHVFLLVLKLGTFTKQHKETLETFKKAFHNGTSRTIVLFTHGDRGGVDAFIKSKESLSDFIKSCAAYHVFYKVKDESQVGELLQKINSVFQKESGKSYKNEMFENALKVLEEVMKKPEVESAPDRNQAAVVYVEGWISKGLDVVKKQAPFLSTFLEKVIDVAEMCMPQEAYKSK